MNYWLMKSEPDVFGIDDLKNKDNGFEPWDGVRNYQARNYMKDMKKGDMVFFYHSNAKPSGIAGTMKVVKESYPDHTAIDPKSKYFDPKSSAQTPRWFMVDVSFVKKFKEVLSLKELKENENLSDLPLVQKGSRLSIMPVDKIHWDEIMSMVD